MILAHARLLLHLALHHAQAISWSLSLDGAPPPDHMRGHGVANGVSLDTGRTIVRCRCGVVFWSA